MKYKCPRCGHIFSGEIGFCPNCGLKLKYHKDDKPEQNNQTNAFDSFKDQTSNVNGGHVYQPGPAPTPTQTQNQYQNQTQNTQTNQQPQYTNQQPQTNNSGKSNAHNVFAFICAVLAAGFLATLLLLPIFSVTISKYGITDIPASNLDFFVFIFSEIFSGEPIFDMEDPSFIINTAPAFLSILLFALAAILTICALIINLVRMIKKAPYKDSYRGNGITALGFLLIGATYLMFFLPGILGTVPLPFTFEPYLRSMFHLIMIIPEAIFGTYFVLRIVYRVIRSKAE